MKQIEIQSHKGPYNVHFVNDPFQIMEAHEPANTHYIIDRQIAELYSKPMQSILTERHTLLIDANEKSKSIGRIEGYIEKLVANGIRRDHTLVAIGGGITQDITCFIASTIFRGMEWHFFPTTLLAQADSCIGSKSSINVGSVKNLLGTFYPPRKITISHSFLKTLSNADFRSGVGEMLKVHIIAGQQEFDEINKAYDSLFTDVDQLEKFVFQSLKIKQRLAELDEFDKGPRNVMNYGHSFGHAIEAATNFGIPHGIAVTIGMDMANYTAHILGITDKKYYDKIHPVMVENSGEYTKTEIERDTFFKAISKDKKNIGKDLALILLNEDAVVEKMRIPNDETFKDICHTYFNSLLAGEKAA